MYGRVVGMAAFFLSATAWQASAICIGGFGSCDPLLGQVLRGQVFWAEPSGSTWGAMVHFARDGRRCVAFAAVHWSGAQIDEKAKFCFEAGQAHVSKSSIESGVAFDVQRKQQVKYESYYTANIDVVADTVRFQFLQCSRREGAADFTCRPDWGLWSFKMNGEKCEVKVVEPWRPPIVDSSCEKYAE